MPDTTTYNVNGIDIAVLPNGDRDFVAEARAQTPRNAVTYPPSGFNMRDLDEMAARIQARARPAERSMSTYYNAIVSSGESTNAYNTQEIVQRYGHLLTDEQQQRMGYVAPVTEDYSLHPEESARTERISPMQFYKQHWKVEKPVANFLASPPGPTAQELAAADEWLKNSPWG